MSVLLKLLDDSEKRLRQINTQNFASSHEKKAFTAGLLVEEMAELTVELQKNFVRSKENDDKVCEEIADVILLLDQVVKFYGSEPIQKWMDFKIDRYMKRYKEGRL